MANFYKPASNKNTSGKAIIIKIEKLDPNGVGVAYWQGKPLFIPGTLPNETVKAKIIESKNKFSRGKLLEIQTASNKRQEAKCPHFGLCGGCDLQFLSHEEQLLFKQQKIAELFSRSFSDKNLIKNTSIPKLPWQPAISEKPWHYRRKARIGVQFDKKEQATVGFRQKSTNQLAAIRTCPVLVEAFADIFPILKKIIAQLSIKSAIGHIELIQADFSDGTKDNKVLVIRQLKKMNAEDEALWLKYALQENWFVLIDNGKEQNALDSAIKPPELSYDLATSSKITFSSNDFIQVNHDINNAMVTQSLDWLALERTDKVLDLFCGLGNFSLAIAKHVEKVIGVEGVQVMADKANYNATLNQIHNCQFYQADLNSQWLDSQWIKENQFNKVLLDPARAGAEEAVKQIVKLNIPSVLYVSCDPATLARDSAILVNSGYKIERICLMDMFSQTKHIETMVLFTS